MKLFVTHGGGLSLTEAVDRGVPVVAIPIFGDQPLNVKFVEKFKIGVGLEYEEISGKKLLECINEVLNNPMWV